MPKKKDPKADIFGGKGSFAGGLRARRKAMEEEDITTEKGSPSKAFEQGIKSEEERSARTRIILEEREEEEKRTRKERRKKEYGE